MWKRGRTEMRRSLGRTREVLRSLPLEKGEKEKERSKVRASGPDTDRFSRSRDTDEEEEKEEEEEREGRKRDKRIYLPARARIFASRKISACEQTVSMAFMYSF
ncbi:hypothetical protein ACS0PU_003754 [Formica fusca]